MNSSVLMICKRFLCLLFVKSLACVCPDVEDPVCGVDGVTYGNKCKATCAGVKKLKCKAECAKCCPSGYIVAIDGLLTCEDGYTIDVYSSYCTRCTPTRCEGLPLATCLENNNPDLTCFWDRGKRSCQKGKLCKQTQISCAFFEFCIALYIFHAMGCL